MLQEHVQQVDPTNIFRVFINIDGLPIAKSGNASLWLILCVLSLLQNQYILLGQQYGEAKPTNNNVFLQKFVDEAIYVTNKKIH